MGRAKLRMERISKDKTRHMTYIKRKEGIKKKAKELSTLCAVDIVIIVYSPTSNEPEIWPEKDYDHIKKSIAYYKSKKGDQTSIRNYSLIDFLDDRNKKAEDELHKLQKQNKEAQYPTWFEELNGLNEIQLTQFARALENKENSVRNLLEFKKRAMNDQLTPVYNFMSGYDNNIPGMMHYPGMGMGLDQQVQMHNPYCYEDYVRFNNDATPSLIKFNQPVYEGGVGYNDLLNQWAVQQQMVHDGFVMQEHEGDVNNGEDVVNDHQVEGDVKNGEDVMNDHKKRFG